LDVTSQGRFGLGGGMSRARLGGIGLDVSMRQRFSQTASGLGRGVNAKDFLVGQGGCGAKGATAVRASDTFVNKKGLFHKHHKSISSPYSTTFTLTAFLKIRKPIKSK